MKEVSEKNKVELLDLDQGAPDGDTDPRGKGDQED